MKLNKYAVNDEIKYNVLSDEEMRNLGFTDHRKGYWYFCGSVHDKHDITINILLAKDGKDDIQIDVLDENFLQPYDYQHILRHGDHPVAAEVLNNVEHFMAYFQDAGVITGFTRGMYI